MHRFTELATLIKESVALSSGPVSHDFNSHGSAIAVVKKYDLNQSFCCSAGQVSSFCTSKRQQANTNREHNCTHIDRLRVEGLNSYVLRIEFGLESLLYMSLFGSNLLYCQ